VSCCVDCGHEIYLCLDASEESCRQITRALYEAALSDLEEQIMRASKLRHLARLSSPTRAPRDCPHCHSLAGPWSPITGEVETPDGRKYRRAGLQHSCGHVIWAVTTEGLR
jgi:hypothetical protein